MTSETARGLGFMPGASHEDRGRALLASPALGVDLGARYLARLVEKLGADLPRVAAAYNGTGRTAREVYAPHIVALADRYANLDEESVENGARATEILDDAAAGTATL